jgi:hypothetical protein
MPNVQTYVLDAHLNPVPVGVIGELHLGGVGLARGYLNRPEVTAERFLPHPFSQEPGARLYQTGDLARYLPNGELEFLGRVDHQVKVRGYRIELGEIEAALSQHPAVRECVVMAHEDAPGEQRLVAYLVTDQPPPPISELRRFVQEKLPDYMLPAAFVLLEALPLSPNGKLDRQALPAPDQARPELEVAFLAPRTPREVVLAALWAEVLRLERVGLHDNFFDLGGHSLQAVRLATKISTALGLEVSVKSLFLHPSIAALAEALADHPLASQDLSPAQAPPLAEADTVASPADGSEGQPSPFLKIERRPLLSLFATGQLAPVAAAALGYLPDQLLARTGLSRDELIADWYDNLPTLNAILETPWGRIATIRLPRFGSDLYRDEQDLVGVIVEALEMAGRLGARTVSLTGLIPSATDYGRAVASAIAGRRDLPRISTGHATTVAAVVLATSRILQAGGRELAQERVGFLGLGSIGRASLRLMLRCLPHPSEIMLCDLYRQRESLRELEQQLVGELGFRGAVRVLASPGAVPAEFYAATLIVGATNVPEVLDLTRVQSGAMIVDDSGPHCFAVREAVERFQRQADILFTEGGVLRAPSPISQVRALPRRAARDPIYVEAVSKHNPFHITGCVLSGLLSSCYEDLKPTVGLVEDSASWRHYEQLGQLGFQAAGLHCQGYELAEGSIRHFRQRFGGVANPEDQARVPHRKADHE